VGDKDPLGGPARFGPEVVRHVAQLARLDLDEAQVARLARDVGRILDAAQALGELDLEGEAATYRVGWEETGLGAVTTADPGADAVGRGVRPDVPRPSLARAAFLAAAPAAHDPFVVVPTVVDRT